jgi:hypothetical protein
MTRFLVGIMVVAGLSACGKKDNENKAAAPPPVDKEPAKPTEVAKPTEPEKPADPTASWTEQKGAGFTVLAPRAPKEEKITVPSAAGPQPGTLWTGYEPVGAQVMFAVGLADLSAAPKVDSAKVMSGALEGMLKSAPALKVEKTEPLTGDAMKGAEIAIEHVLAGSVQGQNIKMRVRMFYKNKRNYHVQVLYPAASPDAALADKFVESFKLTE